MKNFKKIILGTSLFLSLSSVSFADTSCYEEADNFDEGSSIGGFDKEAAIEAGYEALQDPSQDIYACFLQTSYESPSSVYDGLCGCKEAIDELCSFDWDDGVLNISAAGNASTIWCKSFSFLAY